MRSAIRARTLSTVAALVCAGAAYATPIVQLRDINPGTGAGVKLEDVVELDGRFFFWGYEASSGTAGQPWISDGTEAGTQMVAPIAASGGQAVQGWRVSAGRVYFTLNDGFNGYEIWTSDGTAAGTTVLSDSATLNGGVRTSRPVARPGGIFFTGAETPASSGAQSRLWVSRGTPETTSIAVPGEFASFDQAIGVANETVFFLGNTGTGLAMQRSDGTAANTVALNPGLAPSSPQAFMAVNERMYMIGNSTATGVEVWSARDRIDTAFAVTKDIVAGSGSSTPQGLVRVDDRVFFSASDPAAGRELWVSDGTEAGTQRVIDLNPGIADSTPMPIGAIDGTLYFVATDGIIGRELWRTDGTAAGTALVKDILPGSGSGTGNGRIVNRRLFFVAAALGGDFRLWTSDGTAQGTRRVDPAGPADAADLAAANGKLFLKADSGSGKEPHVLDLLQEIGPIWCKRDEQPLDDLGTVQSVVRLPAGAGTITDLDVRVDLGHGYLGDLVVTLTHVDSGKSAKLIDRPGYTGSGSGCTGDLMDVVLEDGAATTVESNCTAARVAYPRDMRFRPNAPLAVFNGDDFGGRWVLTVEDTELNDTGTLHEWCLVATLQDTADALFADGFE